MHGEFPKLLNFARHFPLLTIGSPGRWFAVQLLKILLAYLTLNYDIEATGPQPKRQVIGDAALPPSLASVRVRRRRRIRDT